MYNFYPDPEVEAAANNHGQDLTFREISIEDVLGKPKERTMNNNVKLIQRPQRGISASTLVMGEYARITAPSGTTDKVGDIVLKTGNGVVNLTTPSVIWPTFNLPQVERLNTGDSLEIIVGFTTEFEDRIRREAGVNKILAIKAVRETTNWGLKESKDYVDALLQQF